MGAQEPIALFWEMSIPRKKDDLSTMSSGDRDCCIGTSRIDNHYLAGYIITNSGQAYRQITLLVEDRYNDSDIKGESQNLRPNGLKRN